MAIFDVHRIDVKKGPEPDHSLHQIPTTAHHPAVQHVRSAARERFKEARGSHDWEHTLRVHRLAQHIGAAESADMVVVSCAAYLHDIGRCYQDVANGRICHADKGARMARTVVQNLPFSQTQKENIIHCVQSHRFRKNHAPETLEAKVIFDADKLDAIGAIGVARAYLFAGEVGARLHNPHADVENTQSYSIDDTGYREYKVKLCKIIERLMTSEGHKIGQGRHEFMELFFNRFIDEHQGKR